MTDELDAVGLARRCFEGFRDALATGDGELFARCVAEDVVFRVPVPSAEWQGEQQGRGRVRDLIRFEYDRLGAEGPSLRKRTVAVLHAMSWVGLASAGLSVS